MADDLNPAVIKRTQDSLGKYVKKPSLTEKLLKKPPFRFLHDVFAVVIRDTGCFVGLYSAEELTFENIKDRDDKMRFLQKMIDVVKLTTKAPLAVRTSKIVAGHEPEKTNELLQLMGEIIEKKLDWKSAVEQVLLGKTPRNEGPTKTKDNANSKVVKESKAKEKPKEKSKDKEAKSKDIKPGKSSSKTVSSISNKDDKNKRIKEKEKSSVPTKTMTAKDKVSKGTKEQDKSNKKSTKEVSNSRSKLAKTESQASNKSSPSPNTLESSKTSLKSIKNDFECNHEELKEQNDTKMIETPPLNSIQNNVDSSNGEVSINNDSNDIQQNEPTLSSGQVDLVERNSAGKSKKSSAKTRKSSGRKKAESDVGKPQDMENTNSLESIKTPPQAQTKTEISESKSTPMKQEPPPPPAPAKEPSPPISLTNEVKRESIFTRENSKDVSSSNQSSVVQRPRTSLRPPSARPPSARPGAPRRRDKNVEIILQPNDQIKMSGIQVKLETFGDLDDDGENLVIIENPNANDMLITEAELKLTESEKIMQDETLEQGHLVQQILETQKELVQQNDAKSDKNSTNALVMRQTSARHMNNLRDVIQNLTKSVNPLGKLMDFIPEDIDAMQLEFTMWRDAYTQAANELKREKSLTESATEPMKNQLVQIEANLTEYMEMIDASRVKILQNTEKILKMLTTS